MCGRFATNLTIEQIEAILPGIRTDTVDLSCNPNTAPTQQVLTVLNDGNFELSTSRWGLVPRWAKDLAIGNRMINARAETVAEKPAFRTAFRHNRCLILATGFYEWQTVPGSKKKVPCFFRRQDHLPVAFAGLWDVWKSPQGEDVRTCVIVTGEANEVVAPVHDRMPVILSGKGIETWLQPGKVEDEQELLALLRPFEAAPMERYEVSTAVNNPRNTQEDLFEEVGE